MWMKELLTVYIFKRKQSTHILVYTPLGMVGLKHQGDIKLTREAEGSGKNLSCNWEKTVSSAAEGEDCLVQFANGSGVGMDERGFGPRELKCKPTQKE